ncbi:hypothetical protein B0T36_02350 [Nocardia donostiensis]|uniref:hypothetical protein n=1 Tax=Nocardia donostiensis TaxID=1538463 RepID=UPI0009DA98DD|nr:hypothetical protein [Nocardia donostiensis]OQS16553.1 hypothetical protein B0T36_02350 [Nocardia donostiensis]
MSDTEQGENTDIPGMLRHWQTLKNQATAGELRLDPEVGTALRLQADQMLSRLEAMVGQAANLAFVTGFGGLKSAQDLQKKFSLKADHGDDSAVKRLKESIEIVKLMRDTYELAIRKIDETDQSTAGQLGATGNQ